MLNNYNKPVLTSDLNSGYKGEYNFSLSIEESKIENDFVCLRIKCNMNSGVINNILNDNLAFLGIRVKTNFRSVFYSFNSIQDEYFLDVDVNDLEKIDAIKCTAYIVTKDNIDYPWNSELKDYFDNDLIFKFNRNEILAESNEDRIEYSSSAEPFISLKASQERDDKGLFFDIKSQNMITIKVGKKYNEAYKKLQSEDKKVCVKDILNSFLAFNSILYAITSLSLKEDISEDKEKGWFKSLDYCYDDENYESLESFIEAMHNDINLDEIYRVAQNIINNQLEYKVIDTWRRTQ